MNSIGLAGKDDTRKTRRQASLEKHGGFSMSMRVSLYFRSLGVKRSVRARFAANAHFALVAELVTATWRICRCLEIRSGKMVKSSWTRTAFRIILVIAPSS